MTMLSKITTEFDKIKKIMAPITKTNNALNMSFLVSNYVTMTKQINVLNRLREDAVKQNDEVNVFLFDKGVKANKNTLDTFEKMTSLSSNIVKLLLSQQIILTTNSLDSEFRLITISDNSTTEGYLVAIDSIISALSGKTNEEIESFVHNAKVLIQQNDNLKKAV